MTIDELITELEQYHPEKLVKVWCETDGWVDVTSTRYDQTVAGVLLDFGKLGTMTNAEWKYADAAPTPKRIRRYRALAKLQKLDPTKGEDHTQELWDIVMRFAVLDETMRWPNLYLPSERGVEAKFETIMRHVQKLANTILDEQGYVDDPNEKTPEEPKPEEPSRIIQ